MRTTEPDPPRSKAWPQIKRFWPHLRIHARYVYIMVALLLVSAPLGVISPLIIRRVIDDAITDGSESQFLRWGGLLLLLTLASVLLGLGIGYCSTIFHTKVIRDLRLRLYRHMQSLSLSYFARKETGHLMSRQIDDIGNLGGVMADAFGRGAVELLKGIAFTAMLFYVEWRMALGGLVLALVVFGFEYLISRPLRDFARTSRERWTDVSEQVHQSISGHQLITATASERRENRRFAKVLHHSVRADLKRSLFALWTNHIFHLIAGVAPTLVILIGTFLIVSSDFTVGGLFAFFMYLMQMFGAFAAVAALNPALQNSLASLERIFEVLDTEPEVPVASNAVRLVEPTGQVTFRGVGFQYDDERNVLHDINMEVAPRTTVALVGPSGAGKTTLAQLIPRFHDPSEGAVLVDGHDLRNLDLIHFRRSVGFVPQEVFLFDRSIRENIALGRPDATDEDVREAARAANALDFIEETAEGFDTVIGERGVRLSGGQRQRLAIAREILRDPAILILDEATSSLDSASEALIQEALALLFEGRTSFVIAHRLSTVMRADVIMVMDRGSIVEQGTHSDLLAAGGLYAQLFHSQFSDHLRDS